MWDGLFKIVEEARDKGEKKLFAWLADMLLASQAPQKTLISVLEQIVDASTPSSIPTAARWLRILYHLCTTEPSNNTDKASSLLERAIVLADDAPPDVQYPAEELEWLSTTTFNRAVDAYCSNDEESCRQRVEEALNVAERLGRRDGGRLKDAMLKRAKELLGVRGRDD